MMNINKNHNRENFTFANINLLGTCNANCYFCLGKDISKELAGKNQLNVHFTEWKNFSKFLETCKSKNIKKLYLTGQTADGLQYHYIKELVNFLQGDHGFSVGVRTNGYLALQKMDVIKLMKEEIGYSIHTLDAKINKTIMGIESMPDWDRIIPASGNNVRVAIVVNRYNINEIDSLIKYISKFKNVRYIQIRRISTETRKDELMPDIELYEKFYNKFSKDHKQIGTFYLAQQFELYGKEVDFWRTVETSCNSLNYFTDGTCSDEYFIIDGYLKNKVV